MFCPKCGNADQQPESYCRRCGVFVVDYSVNSMVLSKVLGGSTPSTQVNVNLAINLLTIFACFLLIGFLNGHYDALKARTGENTPTVIYLVYVFLVTISVWQIFSLVVGARLRGKLGRKHGTHPAASGKTQNNLESAETNKLAPHREDVPQSVTEESTRILRDAPRK